MTANHSGQPPREAVAGGPPLPAGGGPPGAPGQAPLERASGTPAPRRKRRHRRTRWIVHGVLFVALAVGVFALLPRIGGLAHDATRLRHARPGFVVAAVLAQAVSLGCYALLYRRVLASLGPGCRSCWRCGSSWRPSWSAT